MADQRKRENQMLKRMTSLRTAAGASGRFRKEISEEADISSLTEDQKDHIRYLKDDQLLDDPDNELIYGSDPDEELVDAMRRYGFQGVILAYPTGNGKYMIEAGHRRRSAARKAGLKEYRVYETVPPASDSERRMRLLMSNLHSRKESPMKLAKIAQNLYETHRMIIEEKRKNGTLQEGEITALNRLVAGDMELNDSTVERYRALLKLIPQLQVLADSGDYSWSDISTASPLDEERQKILYDRILAREKQYGSEAVTRKWLQSEIKSLKSGAGKDTAVPSSQESRGVKRTSYTAKAVMKNAGTMTDILSSELKIKKEDVPQVIDTLEKMKIHLQEKIDELRSVMHEKEQ